MKTIAINGSSGFIGQALCTYLSDYYIVIRINRADYLLNPEFLASKIEGADIVMNIAGASVSHFWTKKYQRIILTSRIDTTRNLIKAIQTLGKKPELFISASAIGVYDSQHQHSENSTDFGKDFLAGVCLRWEREALTGQTSGMDTTIIRIGIVLGRTGGMLPKMIGGFSFGLGAVLGSGKQNISFLHISDLMAATRLIIDRHITGVVNMVAPESCTNTEFSKVLAGSLKRPLWFKIPEWVLKLVLRKQSTMVLGGQRVLPTVLQQHGFVFQYPRIGEAINNLIQKEPL